MGATGTATELHERSARAIADDVRTGRLRAREVLEACLARIERLNPVLNAFVFLDPDRARQAMETHLATVENTLRLYRMQMSNDNEPASSV